MKALSHRIDDADYNKLTEIAEKNFCSIGHLVKLAIKDFLERPEIVHTGKIIIKK